jgi:hypothetical protein
VVARALRLVALVASLVVLSGFVVFVIDEASAGSRHQQSELDEPGLAGTQAPPPRHRTGLRRAIEDANGVLLEPFAIDSSNAWVSHGVPTLLALLVYGVGLGFLARWVAARS